MKVVTVAKKEKKKEGRKKNENQRKPALVHTIKSERQSNIPWVSYRATLQTPHRTHP